MTNPDKQMEAVYKRFDEKFRGAVLIWYKAFVKDAKKYGYKPTLDFEHFEEMPIGKDMLKDFLKTEIDRAVKEERERIKKDFIREFCNDHSADVGIRWLRGVAFDMDNLLEQILKLLSRLPNKGDK